MRKVLQTGMAIAIVLLSLACAVFALCLNCSPVFEPGESYELYYGASSSALIKETNAPLWDKLLSVTAGESVRYKGDRYEDLKEKFGAELLFEENVCGVMNYYLYSPKLGGGVLLKGYTVNLHIAVSEEQTAAGTPLIFGGF